MYTVMKLFSDIKTYCVYPKVPNVTRCEYQLVSIIDGYLEMMDQAGKLRTDVHFPRGDLRDEATSRWEEGENLLVTVLSGMGQKIAISVRAAPN